MTRHNSRRRPWVEDLGLLAPANVSLAPNSITALYTQVRGETVRKGSEQRSEGGFGHYEGAEIGREGHFRPPVGPRYGHLRDFSDSLGR
jgi:hypothetical protein